MNESWSENTAWPESNETKKAYGASFVASFVNKFQILAFKPKAGAHKPLLAFLAFFLPLINTSLSMYATNHLAFAFAHDRCRRFNVQCNTWNDRQCSKPGYFKGYEPNVKQLHLKPICFAFVVFLLDMFNSGLAQTRVIWVLSFE